MTLEHLHSCSGLFKQINTLVTLSFDIEDTYKKLVSMEFVDINTDIFMNNLNFFPSIPGVKYKHSAGLFVCYTDILHTCKLKHVIEILTKKRPLSLSSTKINIPEFYKKVYRLGININNMNFFMYNIYNVDSSSFSTCVGSSIDWYKRKEADNYLYVEDIEEFFKYVEMFKYDKNLI